MQKQDVLDYINQKRIERKNKHLKNISSHGICSRITDKEYIRVKFKMKSAKKVKYSNKIK